MTPFISIRHVKLRDLKEIEIIERLNFSDLAIDSKILEERIAKTSDPFIVVEWDGKIVAYASGRVTEDFWITDALFDRVSDYKSQGGFLALTCHSVHPDYQRQGLGTLLLAALKEIVVSQAYKGIQLLATEEMIPYYQMNGFVLEGLSDSKYRGLIWYQLGWENE